MKAQISVRLGKAKSAAILLNIIFITFGRTDFLGS